MNNKKSYTEHMKDSGNNKNNHEESSYVKDVYIQMIIDESLFLHKKNTLLNKINEALDTKNKERFQQLSKQYKAFIRYA